VLVLIMLVSFAGMSMASTEGELLIWADDTRSPVLQDVKARFQETFGIDVEIQELQLGDIRQNLGVAGPAGEGPDILIGQHDWLGELVANGLIEPISLGEKKDSFYPVTLEAFSWDGKLYAVPYTFESIGLIYNKDFISEAPETFAEFREIIENTSNDETDTHGFVMPQPDPYHTFPFMSAKGGYVFANEDGVLNPLNIGLNNDGAIEGLSYLDKLYEEDLVKFIDYQTMQSLFTSGQAAMMLSGPWIIPAVEDAGIDYGFAMLPTIDGETPKPFVGVSGMMISSFSENKMLAKAFLSEFVATEDTMRKLYELGKRPPAYIPVGEEVSSDPVVAGVLNSAANGTPMPSIPEMAAVWQAWSDALEVVLQQKQDPQPAMDNAVQQIKDTIQEGQ
ncbi:MAG: extracellular solute-binding protein, partial [Halanaerobiales bacterium]